MPLGYNSQYQNNGDSPGTAARRAQVRAAAQDVDPAAEARAESGGRVIGGSAGEPSHRALASAQRGLNRQLRTQQGKPLYKNGKFIGNQAP